MNKENVRFEKRLQIPRNFLRDIYNVSSSPHKLRASFGKATLAQLRVLIGILRATSKGVLVVKDHRYQKISKSRSFYKVEQLSDYRIYRKLLTSDRSELLDFIIKLVKVWQFYLVPLFVLFEDE